MELENDCCRGAETRILYMLHLRLLKKKNWLLFHGVGMYEMVIFPSSAYSFVWQPEKVIVYL